MSLIRGIHSNILSSRSRSARYLIRQGIQGTHQARKYKLIQHKIHGGVITNGRNAPWRNTTQRTIVNGVLRSLPRFLKLRYLVLGGAVSGGAAVSRWRDTLPDISWLRDFMSDETKERFASYRADMAKNISHIKSHLSLPDKTWIPDSVTKSISHGKESILSLKSNLWDKMHLPAGGSHPLYLHAQSTQGQNDEGDNDEDSEKMMLSSKLSDAVNSSGISSKQREKKDVQEELIALQMQYQHEIDKLEKENRELRRQALLRKSDEKDTKVRRSMKKSPIDMYSEVLDELSIYDSGYDTHDHLPRVVVVGDQSSGKTSVLEMIAQARIFPRGSGEMMTRSPVMVTLSEGPFHVAKFRDSSREYDLSKESELAALRREVEVRMRNSVANNQTISTEVISMTVKGPGLQRMVLVDLPGVISTVTTGMASDTKSSIRNLCRKYMENPNAIILCIQDGSIDAERSNVTDLVSSIDKEGKRTIFVLTKVDLAETSLYNPERIKKIMEGRLFPMKALGYFAVVTGKGNQNDSISYIKEYEETFFQTSKLFKDGVLKPTQMTTRNLSMAVSKKFWRMVQDSVEQQADEFKATWFNLETEWKNTYPNMRELDRLELFEKSRGEILDQLITLSQIKARDWEEAFSKKLWDKTSAHVFEAIYLPASSSSNIGTFNTTVDIKLKQWADQALPRAAVDVGNSTLRERFTALLADSKAKKDDALEPFKMAVVDEVFQRHFWDSKAEDSLRVLQQMCLEDRSIHSKIQWESAVDFMEKNLLDMQAHAKQQLYEMTGPSFTEQWTSWKSRTSEQANCLAVKYELERLLGNEKNRKSQLSSDEMTTIRQNLQSQKISASDEMIKGTWHHVYRHQFLTQTLTTARMCRKAFSFYQKGLSPTECGLDCKDIELFWRVQQMLQTTSNALRQQVINHEARRLERIMKEVLDDFSDDSVKLEKLITGKRVKLAEELKRVRHIQDKLEEFIQCLNQDKS